MLRKFCLVMFVLLWVIPLILNAQSSSKIVGQIIDQSTGDPLAGVNIMVENTSLGAVSDNDGFFIILNIRSSYCILLFI